MQHNLVPKHASVCVCAFFPAPSTASNGKTSLCAAVASSKYLTGWSKPRPKAEIQYYEIPRLYGGWVGFKDCRSCSRPEALCFQEDFTSFKSILFVLFKLFLCPSRVLGEVRSESFDATFELFHGGNLSSQLKIFRSQKPLEMRL